MVSINGRQPTNKKTVGVRNGTGYRFLIKKPCSSLSL
jgi:hypothetical protein